MNYARLPGDAVKAGPMDQLRGHSITYRIAIGPQQGQKVFTLQTLPACNLDKQFGAGNVDGYFSTSYKLVCFIYPTWFNSRCLNFTPRCSARIRQA